MRRITLGVIGALLLTACGGAVGPGSGENTEAIETMQSVEYYYACGNEVLELPDGRRAVAGFLVKPFLPGSFGGGHHKAQRVVAYRNRKQLSCLIDK